MFVRSDVVCDGDCDDEFYRVDDGVRPVLFGKECRAREQHDSGGEESVEKPHGFS